MKKNFQITVGYRSVINIDVKAHTEAEAEKLALEIIKTEKGKMFRSGKMQLQDDRYAADGILNMDETWYQL